MPCQSPISALLAALLLAGSGLSAPAPNGVVARLGGLLDVPEMKRTLGAIFRGASDEVPDDDAHRIFVYTILAGVRRVCGNEHGGLAAYVATRYVEPALSARGFLGSLDEAINNMSEHEVRESADRLGVYAGERVARLFGCGSDRLRGFNDNLGWVFLEGIRRRK